MSTSIITKEILEKFKKSGSPITPSPHNYRFNIRNYVNLSRLIIMMITLAFTLSGTYYALFLTPKYEAKVYLSSKIYASLSANALSNDKVIPVDDKETSAPRQLVLLQSPNILRKLVERMQLDIKVVAKSYDQPITNFTIGDLWVPTELYNTDLIFKVINPTTYSLEIPKIKFKAQGILGKEEEFPLKEYGTIRISIVKMPAIANTEYVVRKQPNGEVVNNLLSNFVFEAEGADTKLVTNLITVSYTDMNPARTTEIVNTLAKIAVEESREQERLQAGFTVDLMEIEKNYILDLLNKTGSELAALSVRFEHVAFDEKVYGKLFADEIADLDKNIALAQSELSSTAQTVTEKHPKYKEAFAVYKTYVDKKDAYNSFVMNTINNGSSILDLQRDLVVYTTLYQDACRNLQQFIARLQEPIGDLRIVELASAPDTPSTLSRPLIVFLSLVIGLICGYIVALVFD